MIRPRRGGRTSTSASSGTTASSRPPRLARRRGPLQADVDRRRLGDPPAVPDDGRLHARLREVRELPLEGRSVPDLRLSRAPALDVLRLGASRSRARASSRTSALVTKVYFPRVLLPLAGVVVPLVDFLLASVVLVGMMAWFTVWPSPAIVLAPLFLAHGARDGARRRALPLRRQRPLPRRPVRDPVPDPDLDVPLRVSSTRSAHFPRSGSGFSRSTR